MLFFWVVIQCGLVGRCLPTFRRNVQGEFLNIKKIRVFLHRHESFWCDNWSLTCRTLSWVPESVKILLTVGTALLNKLWLGPVTGSKVSDRPCALNTILVECNSMRGGLHAACALQGAHFDFEGHRWVSSTVINKKSHHTCYRFCMRNCMTRTLFRLFNNAVSGMLYNVKRYWQIITMNRWGLERGGRCLFQCISSIFI